LSRPLPRNSPSIGAVAAQQAVRYSVTPSSASGHFPARADQRRIEVAEAGQRVQSKPVDAHRGKHLAPPTPLPHAPHPFRCGVPTYHHRSRYRYLVLKLLMAITFPPHPFVTAALATKRSGDVRFSIKPPSMQTSGMSLMCHRTNPLSAGGVRGEAVEPESRHRNQIKRDR
jgi:hypothetical protein